MAKIIGEQKADFMTKDGAHIEGTSFFVTADIDPRRGSGQEAEKVFLSSAKLKELSFFPRIGDNIEILYTRFGKIRTLRQLELDEGFEIE